MNLEKLFTFLLIVFSLVGAVFLVKKEIASLDQNDLPLEETKVLEEVKERYAQLKQTAQGIDIAKKIAELGTFVYQNKLSLKQKIGQLFIVGIEGKTVTPKTENLIKNFYPGGVLLLKKNIESPDQVKKMITELQKISLETTGLPLFIAVDQEGGPISRIDFLQEKTAQTEIETVEQAYQVGLKRGQELRELGINVNLAPVLDAAEPGDFLFERTFQKQAPTSAALAKSIISGQKQAGILTCLKHFPGYAGISFNPEEKLAVMPEIPEISQFQDLSLKFPEMVMTSNVVYQEFDKDLPFTFSAKGIQFLKEKLGEEIVIVSDDLSQNSLLNKFSLDQVVALPLKAGVDILIFSGWRSPVEPAITALQKAFQTGRISEQALNQSLSRIIKLKTNLIKRLTAQY